MPGQAEFSLETAMRFFIDEKSVEAVNRGINQIKSMARTALGAIGIGLSFRSLNQMAEQYKSINLSLQSVLGANDNLKDVQEKIKLTARDVRGEYDKIAENVKTLVQNNKRVFDINTATRFTDIMYKLTKMSGGNNSQASAAVQSLSSAMRNGKIDRGAIDNLINNVPQAIKVLTAYYGVSQERLRSMAQAGLIRSAQIRDAFMQAGVEVDKAFENVDMNITDVLSSFRSEFMAFIGETDEMLGITKTLAKYLKQILDMAMTGLQKARSGLLWLSDKLGGMENVLKLLAILAGSFYVAFHFKDIISGLSNIIKLFSTLGLKGMALIAIIALIAIMIDDIIHFMKGDKKTLLGQILDENGIDTDGVRKKINDTIDGIKNTIKDAWEAISGWTKEHWPEIQKTIVTTIKTIAHVASEISKVVRGFFSGIKKWWDEGGAEQVVESVERFKDSCIKAINALKEWWDQNGDSVIQMFTDLGESLGKAFGATLELLTNLFALIVDLLTMDLDSAKDDLSRIIENLGDLIGSLLDAIFGKGFAEDAKKWGSDFISAFWEGIQERWQTVKDFLMAVPNAIKKQFGIPVEEAINEADDARKKRGPRDKEELLATVEENASEVDDRNLVERFFGLFAPDRQRLNNEINYEVLSKTIKEMGAADIAHLMQSMDKADPLTATVQKLVDKWHPSYTYNQTFNQNNTFEGGSMEDQKKTRNNIDKANDGLLDRMSRDIAFSY